MNFPTVRPDRSNGRRRQAGSVTSSGSASVTRRKLLPLPPTLLGVDVDLQRRLVAADQKLPAVDGSLLESQPERASDIRQIFAHPLMAQLKLQGIRERAPPDRTAYEYEALRLVDQDALGRAGGLTSALASSRRSMGKLDVAFRVTEVGLSDGRGGTILYPEPIHAAPRMEFIRQMLESRHVESPTLHAITALVLTLNMHPWLDGNGRTARMLFNLVLQRHGLQPPQYVPLSTISLVAQGGFALAVREVEIIGRWDRIIRNLCMTLECLSQ